MAIVKRIRGFDITLAVPSPAEALRDGGDCLRGLLHAGLGGGGGCVRLCVLLEGGDGLEEGGAPLQLVSVCGPFFVWKDQLNIISS